MNRQKLDYNELSNVNGGWNESQLNAEEYARFRAIRDRLETIKETGSGSQQEIDQLLKSLNEFERQMADKYGAC